MRRLGEAPEVRRRLNLAPALRELEAIERMAAQLHRKSSTKGDDIDESRLGEVSRSMFLAERALCPSPGLPGRRWFRNRYAAPELSSGYEATPIPGIKDMVDQRKWDIAQQENAKLAEALRNYRRLLGRALTLFGVAVDAGIRKWGEVSQ